MTTPNNSLMAANPKDLLTYLTKSRGAIEMALPKHLNPDRMMRLAITCFSTQPALRNCTAQSILASVVVASQLGLEIGVAGQGYLVPYKQTCTFVPGWQGLVSLLNNTGRATAWTGSVFEGDEWEFELGSKPTCRHLPGKNFGDPEKLIWVYACGKVNGSEQPVIEAWPVNRVVKHRNRFNKVGEKHYSFQHFEMYARKVVLLQVLKYMPRSIELNNAIAAADAAEVNHSTVVENGVVIDIGETEEPKPEAEKLFTKAPSGAAAAPDDATTEDAKSAPGGTKSVTPEETLPQKYERLLAKESGVNFDDFRSFIGTKNIAKDTDSWGSWAEVPLLVYEVLQAQPKTVAELIKKFGQRDVVSK